MKYKLPRRRTRLIRTGNELRKRYRLRKPIPRTVVPSFFTLMNLFSGFVAIVQIHEGRLEYGAWLIIAAGLFDALDGFMARLANATSDFGVELDSLSDVVSFGVAPGFLLYQYSFQDLHEPGIMLAALPALCGAVRLARFNVEAGLEKGIYFKGLPIPAMAAMIVGVYLTFGPREDLYSDLIVNVESVLIPMVVLLSFLMVSTVQFDKIPRFNAVYIKENPWKTALFVVYGMAILIFREFGLMAVFSFFIGKGLLLMIYRFIAYLRYGDSWVESNYNGGTSGQ